MVRGLVQHIAESDIEDSIKNCGLQAKDIRLIRKKETGNVIISQSPCMPCHAWWPSKIGNQVENKYTLVQAYESIEN